MVLQVVGALNTAGEHKKALEQAEKMEQEFVSLMTGQRADEDEERQPPLGAEEREGRREVSHLSSHILLLCIVLYTTL